MIRHISAIAEVVDDVDAAVEFYRDVLGLTVDHQPGGGYATIEISGALHFSIWSRSYLWRQGRRRPYPARLFSGVRSRLGKISHGRYRRARLGSRSAAKDGVLGSSDEPLHAAQRNARRILGNALGPSNHSGPQGSIRVIGSLYIAIDLPVIDTSGGIQCYTKCVRYS